MPSPLPEAQRQVVGAAIQKTMAARLGRGFLPLALLATVAIAELITAGGWGAAGWVLLGGSASTAVAMLAYGLRVVQRTFGRSPRPWMIGAGVGGVVPPVFGVYVLGWRGLRAFATAEGVLGVLLATAFAAAGVWVLRSWMRVVEVERLASVMSNVHEGGSA